MVLSNVELYEALKGPIGPEAARMIAEVVPPANELATKQDVDLGLAELRASVIEQIGQLESRLMGRLWVMFVPLWVGLYGLIATLLVRG